MRKKAKRGYAATELIIIYGIAVLTLMAMVGVLMYTGALDSKKMIMSKCILEPGIACMDFSVQESSIVFVLRNAKGKNIEISSISVGSCSGAGSGPLKNGEQAQFIILGCNNNLGDVVVENIYFTYVEENGFNHTIRGELTGIVESGAGEVYEGGNESEEEEPVEEGEEPAEEGLDIPAGSQRYFFRSNPSSPQLLEAIIDPLDVHVGDIQTMTVKARDKTYPIISVIAAVETDTGERTYQLLLIEGTSSSGTWQGSWTVVDTHSRTYQTIFTVENSNGETSSATLTWDDPCAPPPGGAWTLDDNCGITGTHGVSNGNVTIADYTMTINNGAVFVWNPGKSISITTGSIAIADGGELRQSYLWMKDSDADGYPLETTMYAADTVPEGNANLYRERYFMSTYSSIDVNDLSPTVWQSLNCYQDLDGDTYTVGSAAAMNSGADCPTGYKLTSSGVDCDDNNAGINPASGALCNYLTPSCAVPADDANCGTIDCDGLNYYYTDGSASATGTNYCKYMDYPDITSGRCEGYDNCKDANTADCTSPSSSTVATCGTCKYATGACSSCTNYDTSTSCSGTLDCDYLNNYQITGTQGVTTTSYCTYYDYADTTQKCDGAGSCSALNCGSPSSSTQATADTCKYISGCSGGTSGTVSNYADGTACGSSSICKSGVCTSRPTSYSSCTLTSSSYAQSWICAQGFQGLNDACRAQAGSDYWIASAWDDWPSPDPWPNPEPEPSIITQAMCNLACRDPTNYLMMAADINGQVSQGTSRCTNYDTGGRGIASCIQDWSGYPYSCVPATYKLICCK